MDCEHCQETLLDLASGTLAVDDVRAARDHVDGCEQCRADLERIEGGLALARDLPEVEPPAAVRERVLALAATRGAGARAAGAPPGHGRLRRLADFLGSLALEHQVAMAAVFLLVVTIGLWSVPKLRQWPEAAGGAVVHPDLSGEVGPSAELAPAEPLDLTVDHRRGRIRTTEEVEAAKAARPAAPEPSPWPGAAELDDEYALAERALQANAEKKADSEGRAEREVVPAPAAAAPTPDPDEVASLRKSAPAKASRPRSMDDLLDGALSGKSAPETGRATAGASAAVSASEPAAAPAASTAATALQRARSLERSGGCAKAVAAYRELARRYPRTPEAGEALLESARCELDAGRTQAARTDLAQAAAIPATAARARVMLNSLSAAPAAAPAYR